MKNETQKTEANLIRDAKRKEDELKNEIHKLQVTLRTAQHNLETEKTAAKRAKMNATKAQKNKEVLVSVKYFVDVSFLML